ncbi:PREDICTED: MLP-like protein 423 [Camelina sativa]|uniref:MLP-like protein 423 n=1 Tax=Camelina sativa TaxID=90675 RepID=A0ABM1R604_CAMSA|nr:PREDICTED: MLP-like protein 423 [Camelina sativa]
MEYYKTFEGTITVIPKDGGSLLKWYEIADPHVIKDFAVKNFKEIDEYLLKQRSPLVNISDERIEAVDLENKIIPKDGGSLLKWSGEFEKTSHEIADPHVIKDFAVKNFKEIDEYLLKQSA